jgi:protein-L-isoaspartate(D-aspartate) O-methyltransferase
MKLQGGRAPARAAHGEPAGTRLHRGGAAPGARLRLAAIAVLVGAASLLPPPATSQPSAEDAWSEARAAMVEQQIRQRDVRDPAVLAAFSRVPRHLFVPEALRTEAYADRPLPIGEGQTITQPYVAAMMTSLLGLGPGSRVLEVGTGSGYQAAVLAEIAAEVYTVEIREAPGKNAARLLADLGYRNVQVRIGDGYRGWPEKAPFDAIVVTAAPPRVPAPLVEQLAVGGRLVVPVGGVFQDLLVITKTKQGVETREVIPVRLAPMAGEASKPTP